jgi:hypothetical protein
VFPRNDGLLFAGLHGVITQKTDLFITTAVRRGGFIFRRSAIVYHFRNLNLVALVALTILFVGFNPRQVLPILLFIGV